MALELPLTTLIHPSILRTDERINQHQLMIRKLVPNMSELLSNGSKQMEAAAGAAFLWPIVLTSKYNAVVFVFGKKERTLRNICGAELPARAEPAADA